MTRQPIPRIGIFTQPSRVMTNTRQVGSIQFHGIEPGRSTMAQDYEFEVTITAVVRVRAQSESLARKVVASSALASPSADDIRLANEAEFVMGKGATVVSVDFSVEEDSITLVDANDPAIIESA